MIKYYVSNIHNWEAAVKYISSISPGTRLQVVALLSVRGHERVGGEVPRNYVGTRQQQLAGQAHQWGVSHQEERVGQVPYC